MEEGKRFPAKEGAVAAFVEPGCRAYTSLGEIVDMSMEGLSLKYLSKEGGYGDRESVVVDIFGIHRPLLGAGKVLCRVVKDISLTQHRPDSLNIRLCTLEFQGLSREQAYNISHFVDVYSIHEKKEKAGSPS
jgi:hypothetical protein